MGEKKNEPEQLERIRARENFMYSQFVLLPNEREAVGCVAIESSRLEEMVETVAWALLGVNDDQGRAVTGQMMFAHKYGLLQRLIGERGGEFATGFEPLHQRIARAMDERRQIIHGSWTLPETESIRNYLRALVDQEKRSPEMEARAHFKKAAPFKASAVIETARELYLLYYDLARLASKHLS